MAATAVRLMACIAMAATLGACAIAPYPSQEPGPVPGASLPSAAVAFGTISAIDRVNPPGSAGGSGALIGGAVGAIVGRELGEKAMGRTAATVVGAAAGAMIGNEIERQHGGGKRELVRVSVQLDDGGTRSFDLSSAGDLRVGDRVRVESNRIQRF